MRKRFLITNSYILLTLNLVHAKSPVVLMTDFEIIDSAVSAMNGVIYSVDQNIIIEDLTHKIEPFNIQEPGYRLYQAIEYYHPKGTFSQITFEQVGKEINNFVKISLFSYSNNTIYGHILVLDSHYGNLWTNIEPDLISKKLRFTLKLKTRYISLQR